MQYLVKMVPMEPYCFGTDKSAPYIGAENGGKGTYFIKSKEIPEQTTLLGALRYMILESQGLLKENFGYTPEERQRMSECIGPESFRFISGEKQEFGYIKEISPLFIVSPQGHICIKNPFNNKVSVGYDPIKMMDKTFETSEGAIHLPMQGEYDAKEGYAVGYYDLSTGMIYKDLFKKIITTGNRKNRRPDQTNKDDCFYKRELICLKEKFAFGLYVNAEKLPEKAVIYMGQRKSAFLISAEICNDLPLTQQVKDTFVKYPGKWQYALSDLIVDTKWKAKDFFIAEEKQLRNLETVYNEKKHIGRLRKSSQRFNLVQSGSVFYGSDGPTMSNENGKQIGYNYIVQLGGM